MVDIKNQKPRPRRVELKIKIDRSSTDIFYQSEIMNISKGGVFIQSDITLPLGSEIDFDFTLPRSLKRINVRGIVVWTRSKKQSHKSQSFLDHPCGMGVAFLKMSESDIQAILREIEANSKKI